MTSVSILGCLLLALEAGWKLPLLWQNDIAFISSLSHSPNQILSLGLSSVGDSSQPMMATTAVV